MDGESDEEIWTYSTKKHDKTKNGPKPKGSSRSTRKSKKSSIIAQPKLHSNQKSEKGKAGTDEKGIGNLSQTPDLRRFSRKSQNVTQGNGTKDIPGGGGDNAETKLTVTSSTISPRSGEKRKASTSSPAQCFTDTNKNSSKKRVKKELNPNQPSSYNINENNVNQQGRQIGKEAPLASNSKFQSSNVGTEHKTPVVTPSTKTPQTDKDGHCPFCQMPFMCLALQSPRWHAMECMDAPLKTSTECPAGLKCDSTIPSHYRRYQHTVLANNRAGVPSVRSTSRAREFISSETGSSFEESPPEIKHVRKLDFDNSASGSKKKPTLPVKKLPTTPPKFSNVSLSTSPYFKQNTGLSSPFKFTPPKKQLTFSQKKEEEDGVSISQISTSSSLSSALSPLRPTPSENLREKDEPETDDDIFFCESKEEMKYESNRGNKVEQTMRTRESKNETTSNRQVDLEEKDISEMISDAVSDEIDKNSERSIELTEKQTDVPDNINADREKEEITTIYSDGEEDEDWFDALQKPFEDDTPDVEYIPLPSTSSHSTFNPKPTTPNQQTTNKVGTKQTSIQNFFKCQFAKTSSNAVKKENVPITRGSLTIPPPVARGGASAQRWPLVRPGTSKVSGVGANGSTSGANGASANKGGSTGWRGKKECPFYKKMPGTSFTVDAFRYGSVPGCRAYILTHFHYDHYGGLTRKFQHPIYCSQITGNLVKSKLKVDPKYINTIPLDTPTVVEGVELTFMEANHCPGSVIILFKLPNNQMYLHTGDFRACPDMERYPALQSVHINQLYLDTTYCDPTYSFPPQKDVIKYSVAKAAEYMSEFPNTLIAVGSYTIGKERIFRAIAEDLNCRVCVTREKKAILDCLEDPALGKRLTLEPREAKVHVLPMRQLNYQNLVKYVEKLRPRFDRVLAFEPTGWTHTGGTRQTGLDKLRPKMKRDNITIYGVPYSEHSSYTEMKRFCQFFRPDRILATVNNGDARSRSKMDKLFESWMKEKIESPSKGLKQTGLKGWFS